MPDTTSELTLNVAGTLTTSSTARAEVTEAADITDVVAVVGTAPTGAALLLDILKNGTTIFAAFGTVAAKSPVAAADTVIYAETPDGTLDISAGQLLLIESEQVLVTGPVTGSSKVDNAVPVFAIPVARAQNSTSAATHAAGVSISPVKPFIAISGTKTSLVENGPLGVTPTVAPGDVISVTVSQVGSTVAGADLEVTVELDQR